MGRTSIRSLRRELLSWRRLRVWIRNEESGYATKSLDTQRRVWIRNEESGYATKGVVESGGVHVWRAYWDIFKSHLETPNTYNANHILRWNTEEINFFRACKI